MGRNSLFRRNSVDKEADLFFLIRKLDGIRAFRRSNTQAIEESFQRLYQTDLWNSIKQDVQSIVFFPNTIPGLEKLMRITYILRQLFPISILSIVLSVIIRIGLLPMPNDNIYLIFLLFPVAIIGAFIAIDLAIRMRIASFEKEHPDLNALEKERIKLVVEDLLAKLIAEILPGKENLFQYKMSLYHNDYRRTEVLRESVERVFSVFKRSYIRYVTIPCLTKKRSTR
ncbi:MAG: hypothetical protein KAV87_19380 [Desulfobacteraceae bacterium]|nr:hypothetical protein [Desulfobacteraceae bacterium]